MNYLKPLVSIATCCERVLEEKDGVISIVRVVDIFRFSAPKDAPPDVIGHVPVLIYVVLKSGDIVGEYPIQLRFRSSKGEIKEISSTTALFEGGTKSVSITGQLMIRTEHIGLNWVDVIWNGEALTAIPITLEQEQQN